MTVILTAEIEEEIRVLATTVSTGDSSAYSQVKRFVMAHPELPDITVVTDRGETFSIDTGGRRRPETASASEVVGHTYINATDFSAVSVVNRTFPSALAIDLFLDPKTAMDLRSNLEELYLDWVDRHGSRKAQLIWYVQIARVVGSHVVGPILTLLERARRLVG